MKINILKTYKSIPAGLSFNLPDFCIITGKNGSGKSHILEAMSNPETSNIYDGNIAIKKIQLIGFGGLNPQMDETCDPQQIVQNCKNWWGQILTQQNNVKQARERGETIEGPIRSYLMRWGNNPALFDVIDNLSAKVSKSFDNLTEEDVYFNLDSAQTNQGTLFASQLALVFKTYHIRYTKNEFKRFLNGKNGTQIPTISDEQFIVKYGPKPWDLVNEILEKAGLTYRVVTPEATDTDTTYNLRLFDPVNSSDISVNDLSTGEKVLMSLALAIYNTQESIGKPDLLILDEPDAPLHPHYSKLLIDTLLEVVVKKAGVRVIVTTHSPSTAALSPDNSLYEMNRETKIPEMISLNRGIEILTNGIPHLRVSIESRRQIFVESKYDVLYFQRLYQIIQRTSEIAYQPIFLEPHSGSSNCTDVESIVTRLYESGNDLVRGIIDWDGNKQNKHPIYVLGSSKRYAIENYLLDPLYVALALIRAGKKTFGEFSVNHLYSYIDASKMSNLDAQTITNFVLNATHLSLDNLVQCKIQNGWILDLPAAFLNMRGHNWEATLLKYLPELNAVATRTGDSGLKLGLLQTIEEFPQFLSSDVLDTFLAIK